MEIKTETLVQFYQRTNQPLPGELAQRNENVSHFNIKKRSCRNKVVPYNRRDHYKICLIRGSGIYRFINEEIVVEQPAIVFTNPMVPTSWESISTKQDGYYCLFNDAFLLNNLRQDIKHASPLFNPSLTPIILLDEAAYNQVARYFTDLDTLLAMDYPYKNEMIRNVLQLLILEGIRLQGTTVGGHPAKATDRIVSHFFDLLNRQFPVDSPENPLRLMTPSEYAAKLNVHVNHLNAMIKKYTGKTTRTVVQERIITEARTLLRNTDWDVTEVAYSLGFEYPSHFNKYFKQYTGVTPLAFRHQGVVMA